MPRFPEDFEVEKDYWIFCMQHKNLKEARRYLIELLREGHEIPDFALVDISRALQKIERMSNDEFKLINSELFGYVKESGSLFKDYQNNFRIDREEKL
jgi:hypothetical protein